jgi:uncharacterized protein YdhG (YjbR/CyaY superfamily)
MAKTDYKTINEYHQAFPTDVRERMQAIREAVHRIAPAAEEVINYQIPAFKIGKSFVIYYSAYTKHISLSSPWSAALLKEFATDLKGYHVTKSAIQLPNDKPLPLAFIKRLVKFRKKEVETVR